MTTLINRHEYIRYRDQFALDSMLIRLEKLKTDSSGALAEARMLRTKMKHAPKGHKRDLVEADYDSAMAAWAKYEVMIGNIERDPRYIAHMDQQAKGQE